MQDLDPTTRERLADLRRLLRDAQARSSDRTSAGQHTAIVLLDAACEHAAALAAGHLGLQKIKDVETTMNQLRAHLPSWQPQGWKGVLELRGQRNQAQHRGTRPDPRDVARWADDAKAFVRSLVRVAFDVELDEVMVAHAVEDLDVRRLLGAAEQALDRQDYAEAKYSAVDAFEAARSRWRGARPRSGVPWYDRREQYVPEGVTADLERLREQAEVRPFASDYGEYLWLMNQHRRYARSAPVPVEDALRALAFVTEWVLRWEHFVHRNVKREDEWLASTPPATSGVPGAKPSIRDIEVIVDDEAEYTDPAMVRVAVTFQDLPDEYRQQWAFEIGQAVTSMELPLWRTRRGDLRRPRRPAAQTRARDRPARDAARGVRAGTRPGRSALGGVVPDRARERADSRRATGRHARRAGDVDRQRPRVGRLRARSPRHRPAPVQLAAESP
jgi:hypothetical protein